MRILDRILPDPYRPLYRCKERDVNSTDRHTRTTRQLAGTHRAHISVSTFFPLAGREIQPHQKRRASQIEQSHRSFVQPPCIIRSFGECHSLRKHSARGHLLSSWVVHAYSVNEAPRRAQTTLTFGTRAAELNHEPCMRTEATLPHELGSYDHATYLLLCAQCFLQRKCAFTQPQAGSRRAPAATGGRARIHARRWSRRAATRGRGRRGSRRSQPRSSTRGLGSHSANACDDPRDRRAPGSPSILYQGAYNPP